MGNDIGRGSGLRRVDSESELESDPKDKPFRKAAGSKVWHSTPNCPEWPKENYISTYRPVGGKKCSCAQTPALGQRKKEKEKRGKN